ncbi:MAG: hydroxyethylthiazole kinase [Acidimicrobiales bacterium]
MLRWELTSSLRQTLGENAKGSADFDTVGRGVLVNVGTLSAERDRAGLAATADADASGTPGVFDPVTVGALAEPSTFA